MRVESQRQAVTEAHLLLDEPVIVLTAARSGSTLLRLILDAHPDLACPPETNILRTFSMLASAWQTLSGGSGGSELSRTAETNLRLTIDNLFSDYLLRSGKRRWCEKSLGTILVANKFASVYPKAKFICLYRHCMDVIYSGLEASPWGLIGYGFEQFSGLRSGNNVSALAAYWSEHTGRALRFEKEYGDRCLRVYYERLVTAPEDVMAEIFAFIGASDAPGITRLSLRRWTSPGGPGDYKVQETSEITSKSLGRGVRIPVGLIPAAQLQVVNQLLGELGYTLVDDTWRKTPYSPALLPDDEAEACGTAPPAAQAEDTFTRSALQALDTVMQARLRAGLARPRFTSSGTADFQPFGIALFLSGEHRLARFWRVAPGRVSGITPTGSVHSTVDWLVTGDLETWMSVLAGQTKFAVAFRSGALRYIDNPGAASEPAAAQEPSRAPTEMRMALLRDLLGFDTVADEVSVLSDAI
jgi:Sulfotransferase family